MQSFINQVFLPRKPIEVHQWFGNNNQPLSKREKFTFYIPENVPFNLVRTTQDGLVISPLRYINSDMMKAVSNNGGQPLEIFARWNELRPMYKDYERPIHKDSKIQQVVNFKLTTNATERFDTIAYLYRIITPLGGYIAGSYAAYVATKNDVPVNMMPKDVDIFVKDEQSFNLIKDKLISEKFILISENELVLTFTVPNSNAVKDMSRTVQLVKPRTLLNGKTFGMPEEIIDSFDFTVSRALILNENNSLVDEDFDRDFKSMTINTKNLQCPIGSSIRLLKYATKGFSINNYQHFLVFSLSKCVDNEDYEELIALFSKNKKYIDALNSQDSNFSEFELTSEEWENIYFYVKID